MLVLRRLLPTVFTLLLLAAPASAATNPPSQRIVGGTLAAAGEWPAQAYLELTYGGATYSCGSTLVTARHLVTAAHCAVDGSDAPLPPGAFVAVVGRADLDQATPSDAFTVQRNTVHEAYDPGSGANDIAILELTRPAPESPLSIIDPAETALWEPNDPATVVGWGRTSTNGAVSRQLREAQVPIVSDAQCASAYLTAGGIDPDTMVCAGDGTTDTCQGDSGGPLMVPRPDTSFALVGITSFGMACADPAFPGVYTRLGAPALNSWLRTGVRNAVATASAATAQPGETVSFDGWATSADGTVGALWWDLDDDGTFTDATGPTASASFTAPGPHRVRVAATDSAAHTIVGSTSVTVPGAPPAGEQTTTPTPPPPPPPAETPTVPVPRADPGTVTAARSVRLRALRSKGLRVRFTCVTACSVTARLTLAAGVARRYGLTKGRTAATIGTGRAFRTAAGAGVMTVRLTARAKRALRRARRLTPALASRIAAGVDDVSFGHTVIVRR